MVLATVLEERRFSRLRDDGPTGADQPVVNDTNTAPWIGETEMATATRSNGTVKVLGLLTIIAGIVMVIAGGVTWGAVSSNLAAEKITVAEDASSFAGQAVNSPWTAFAQADIIKHHALKASNGKTYAELDRDDPVRATVMNGSFLRASLFTSVVSFGVAFFAFGVGIVSILVGWALIKLAATTPTVVTSGPAVSNAAI